MKRLLSVIALGCTATLVTGTLVAVLGSVIGFYDWMWLLVILGIALGLACGLISNEGA